MFMQENAMKWEPVQEGYINFLAAGQVDVEGTKWTKEEYAERIEVNPSTLWRWEQIDGFWDEVSLRAPNYIHRWIPRMTQAMVAKAMKGDVAAYRLLLQQAGRLREDEPDTGMTTLTDLFLQMKDHALADVSASEHDTEQGA